MGLNSHLDAAVKNVVRRLQRDIAGLRIRQREPAEFIIFNTQLLVFNVKKSLVFSTRSLVFNTKFIIFTHSGLCSSTTSGAVPSLQNPTFQGTIEHLWSTI